MAENKVIEVSAKKVEDAIKQGCEQLGVAIDEVGVEVLDAGGMFRKARVRLTLEMPAEQTTETKAERDNKKAEKVIPQKTEKPVAQKVEETEKPQAEKLTVSNSDRSEKVGGNDGQKRICEKQQKQVKPERNAAKPAETHADCEKVCKKADKAVVESVAAFVKDLVEKMGFVGAKVAVDESGDTVNITAEAGDDSLIIGRHGETLSSVMFLAETVARAEKHHCNVVVDCNGYRGRRATSLTAMAKRRADECVAKRRKIKLESMERIDRRTIHNALTADERVTTSSEGKEPHRYVVIIPKK